MVDPHPHCTAGDSASALRNRMTSCLHLPLLQIHRCPFASFILDPRNRLERSVSAGPLAGGLTSTFVKPDFRKRPRYWGGRAAPCFPQEASSHGGESRG